MAADLTQDVFLVVELDDLAARRAAEAETVGHDECAAALDELCQARIVDLAADDGHAGAVRILGVRLALFELGERLAQVGQDERLGAGVAHEVEDVELVARDDRVVELAHLSNFADDLADLVVLGDGLAQRLVGRINAEGLGQTVEHVLAHLRGVGIDVVIGHLERHVGMRDKEFLLAVDLQDLEVLHGAVHGRAGVHADHRIQELVTTLDCTLDERTCVVTGIVGHVVRRDIQRTGLGCSESHRDAVVYVEEDLRNVIAGVAEDDAAVRLRLPHQLVVGVFQKVFKVDQMLQIFQMFPLPS